MKKTNAMRLLDVEEIGYNIIEYEVEDGKVDGVSVTKKIGKEYREVYKTLVTQGEREIYVFVIPVKEHLDLKKAAQETSEKKIEFIDVNDILKKTGYVRGGCSPIGMKKEYKTYIQEDALDLETFIVSGGKIGSQIEMKPEDLSKIVDAKFVDIIE